MKHKLQHVMKQREDSKPLRGFIQIDDSYLGGKSRGGKHGRSTSGKVPFLAVVETTVKGHPVSMKLCQVSTFSKDQVTQWATKHLMPGSMVVSDVYNCFPGIIAAGCTHQAIRTGGGPDSVDTPEFKWVNTMIGNIKNSIRGTYHAISIKYIPGYLAEFCYRFNRHFNLGEMISRLIYIAVRSAPVPQRLLKLPETRWSSEKVLSE